MLVQTMAVQAAAVAVLGPGGGRPSYIFANGNEHGQLMSRAIGLTAWHYLNLRFDRTLGVTPIPIPFMTPGHKEGSPALTHPGEEGLLLVRQVGRATTLRRRSARAHSNTAVA